MYKWQNSIYIHFTHNIFIVFKNELQNVWLNLKVMLLVQVGYVMSFIMFSQPPVFHGSRTYATLIKAVASSYNSRN